MKRAGVYVLANTVTGMVYVGSSSNVDHRRRQHLSGLLHGSHWNREVQKAWDENGRKAFVFVILELVDAVMIAEREQHWLSLFRAHGAIYNAGPVAAKPNLGRRLTEEHKLKLSLAHRGKKLSEEHRRNIGLANIGISRNVGGRAYSAEELAARSRAMIGNKWACGYKQSEETKRKRGDAIRRAVAARRSLEAAS